MPFTEPGKHGYVAFKIKTKSTLLLGDKITNKAEIYFDYNLPIITNVATTTVVANPVIGTYAPDKAFSLQLYPNPSNDFVHIRTDMMIEKVEVFDALGRLVLQPMIQHDQIDISGLKQGMYWVKVRGKEMALSIKLVKK